MALSEKVKGYFEGETRDLERKIAKLDGNIDHLVREQRWTKFAAGTVIAFEVFRDVAPMVTNAFRAVTNAAIAASPHVERIRMEQSLLNDEFDRTKAILGERLIGNVDTLGLKMAGLSGYVSDLNTQLANLDSSQGGKILKLIIAGGGAIGTPLMAHVLAPLLGAAGGKLEERGLASAFVGPLPPAGYKPPAGGRGAPSRPTIASAALTEEGGAFDALGKMVRGGTLRQEMLDVGEAVDVVAHSFSQSELATAQWSVTMDGAMSMASASLQAHLSEQLRFENLKKASGKRIVQSVLADIGSQAMAEAAYQAALAVGYLFINPAKAATHGKAALMLGVVAGSAAIGYAAAGGSFEQNAGAGGSIGGGRDRSGGGSSSARTVAAAAAPGVINFTLTFIYNAPTYYVGPGGLEEFVGEIVPALNSRIDSGELRVA